MTFAIAAAGTGGHVYPGLAVGEALVAAGTSPVDIVYIGGDRLEATVFPGAGFVFEQLEIRGFQRGSVVENLGLPGLLRRARARALAILDERNVKAVLGFGNYITVPVAMAARRRKLPLFLHEQNAHPGMANRLASRWAERSFVSFPDTPQLHRAEFTGNPLRQIFRDFDRDRLRPRAVDYYGLRPHRVTVGVFGGSLGARVLNDAVSAMLASWTGPEIQVVHLVGRNHGEAFADRRSAANMPWIAKTFEERMDFFYAACDVVVARAGGGIAEILATATPAVLVPGGFGSGGHQAANAQYAADAGAAVMLTEAELSGLDGVLARIVSNPDERLRMAAGARQIARPDAAQVIAGRLLEAARG